MVINEYSAQTRLKSEGKGLFFFWFGLVLKLFVDKEIQKSSCRFSLKRVACSLKKVVDFWKFTELSKQRCNY